MSSPQNEAAPTKAVSLDMALLGHYAGAESWYLEYRDLENFRRDCQKPVSDEDALRDMLPSMGEQLAVRAFEEPYRHPAVSVSGAAAVSELVSI